MIIEWVGCSGAGKSTARDAVYKNLHSSGVNAQKPLEIFLGKTISKSISNERLRNLLLDFLVLPWSLYSAAKHRQFLKLCAKTLMRYHLSFCLRIKLLRSILRKTGLYVFLNSSYSYKQPVLVDEGTVHIAHLLFANGKTSTISPTEIEQFCELVPAPDLIVHIMASEPEIIERTFNRKDKPIDQASPELLKQFIALGQEVFKTINDLNPWEDKTIIILNSGKTFENQYNEALKITRRILEISPWLKQ